MTDHSWIVGVDYILNIPNFVSGIGELRAALRDNPRTLKKSDMTR